MCLEKSHNSNFLSLQMVQLQFYLSNIMSRDNKALSLHAAIAKWSYFIYMSDCETWMCIYILKLGLSFPVQFLRIFSWAVAILKRIIPTSSSQYDPLNIMYT